MTAPKKTETESERIFNSTDTTTQELIRVILKLEREEMHKKKRDDIHLRLTQIIKNHIRKA